MPRADAAVDVDGVVAGACTDDEREVAAVHHRCGHLRRPHDEHFGAGLAQGGCKRVVLEARLEDDLATGGSRPSIPDASNGSATRTFGTRAGSWMRPFVPDRERSVQDVADQLVHLSASSPSGQEQDAVHAGLRVTRDELAAVAWRADRERSVPVLRIVTQQDAKAFEDSAAQPHRR